MSMEYLGEVSEHPLYFLLDVIKPLLVLSGQFTLKSNQTQSSIKDPLPRTSLRVLVVVLVGLKSYGCLTYEDLKHFTVYYCCF